MPEGSETTQSARSASDPGCESDQSMILSLIAIVLASLAARVVIVVRLAIEPGR